MTVVLAAFVLSGCGPAIIFGAGAAAGVGGYKYYRGSLTTTYNAAFEETWQAGLVAVRALDLEIKGAQHDLNSGSISAVEADGTPVTVKMKYVSARETEVSIRVGILGEEKRAVVIKDKIAEILRNQV